MKSFVLEAPSVERAIDKAWRQAGCPKEFNIKIIDSGEQSFLQTILGTATRNAVINIMYAPQVKQAGRQHDRRQPAQPLKKNDRKHPQQQQTQPQQAPRRPQESQSTERKNFQSQDWTDEWVAYVVSELKDLLKKAGIHTPFVTEKNHKVLNVTFKEAVLANSEDQRMFFASLSYLAIQLLKRHYKNRFVGFKIVVTREGEPAVAPHDEDVKFNRHQKAKGSQAPYDEDEDVNRGVSDLIKALPESFTQQIEIEQVKFAKAQVKREAEELAAMGSFEEVEEQAGFQEDFTYEEPHIDQAPHSEIAESSQESESEVISVAPEKEIEEPIVIKPTFGPGSDRFNSKDNSSRD